jgi:hypothetical protein
MACDTHRDRLVEILESNETPDPSEPALSHLGTCPSCRAEFDEIRALRARLAAAGRAAPQPALEGAVMARIPPKTQAAPAVDASGSWPVRLLLGARRWRLGLGTAGLVALVLVIAAVLGREPSHAWSIEQSIEAMRPYRALHLHGTMGGNARCELWTRTSADHVTTERLLMQIAGGPIVWIEGNATYYFDPNSQVVYTDDAQTAGFNPWPGPRLFEMAQAVGVRMVDTRWVFPASRRVVTEWSILTTRGPTSARAEFDLETKLLTSLSQWDNMDRQGPPGFEAHDIEYLSNLSDETFKVDLPAGVRYQPTPLEVAESVLGVLAMPDAGMPTPDTALDEAGRRIVSQMWKAVLAQDLASFRRLCPIARGWSDELLRATLGRADDPDAVVEVVEVGRGVVRGHSRLGPLSVVSSRVRHGDGKLYEEKTIVQHRPDGSTPSCVIYSNYGASYRLD